MIRKVVYIIALLPMLYMAISCGDENQHEVDESVLYDIEKVNQYTEHFDSMPPGGRRLRTYFEGSYGKEFKDLNDAHLSAAMSIGIEPITDIPSVWEINRPLEKVVSCKEYFVDELTHSLPYLVSDAADLLREIGQRFNDTLAVRGGGYYRIKVTSVLRTPASIKKLRRRNRNATKSSAHQYGTTFDISYRKFICDSVDIPRTQDDLKGLLAEILLDLRDEQRCYVKHERRQGCFHITTR